MARRFLKLAVSTLVIAGGLAVSAPADRSSALQVATIDYGSIVVADTGHNAVYVFPPGAHGNAAPVRSITGGTTMLSEPTSVAVTSDGAIWVGGLNSELLRFGPAANGDTAPDRVIVGPATGIADATGLTTARDDSVWIANNSGDSIAHFAVDANGNATPLQKISGDLTGLHIPEGVALTADQKDLWVLDNTGLKEFSAEANGNQPPLRLIEGDKTNLGSATHDGIYVEPNGGIWVATGASLEHFAANAHGNAAPDQVLSGTSTTLDGQEKIAPDALGHLWVANIGNKSVIEFGSSPHGNAAPINTLSGLSTTFNTPWGLTIYGAAPGMPKHLAVKRSGHKAVVKWHRPHVTGGGIEAYLLERKKSSGTWAVVAAELKRKDVEPLKAHTNYHFRVAAVNAFGGSRFSPEATIELGHH